MRNFIKIVSLILTLVFLIFTTVGCKKSEKTSIPEADGTVASSEAENDNQDESEDKTTKPGETTTEENETTTKEGETTSVEKSVKTTEKRNSSSSNKTITLTSGLNSSDVSEVLTYYKLVAKKNAGLKMKKDMSLVSLDVGTLVIDGENNSPNREKGLEFFKKGANLALSVASGKADFPGNPSAIKMSDWTSAKAVNDGTYTTVTVKVKTQTDSYNGKEYEGSVGRSMQVLAGFDTAITSINKVKIVKMTADFEHGNVKIEYQNPTIVLKVLNSPGELVKNCCKWSYITKIYLNDLNATMKVMQDHTVSIKNSSGAVDYSVNY